MPLKIYTNALEEDPFIYVERGEVRESFLFDCGLRVRGNYRKVRRLWGIFITHAHIDHLVGFDHLLRSLLNEAIVLRVFGPAGIIAKIRGKLGAYDWDRAADQELVVEVTELRPEVKTTRRFLCRDRFQPSPPRRGKSDGIIRSTDEDEILYAFANHGGSPCMCYSYRLQSRMKVHKEALDAMGLRAGPWVGELLAWQEKGGAPDAIIDVWGTTHAAIELAGALLFEEPGSKLVYITDTRLDGAERPGVLALAAGADLLICEATFLETDRELALQFNHLTAAEAGAFAAEAGVKRLVLNHPSRRYHGNYRQLLNEARRCFTATDIVPYKGGLYQL